MTKLSQKGTEKIFAELVSKDPGNKFCADCHDPNPTWVSTNLGIFLCIKCAGIHRSIGVQISKIRSSSLDYWDEEHLEGVKRIGNTRAAQVWEANLPGNFIRPGTKTHLHARETFIRDKYEKQKWMDRKEYEKVYLGIDTDEIQTKKEESQNLLSFDDCEGKFVNMYRIQQSNLNSYS